MANALLTNRLAVPVNLDLASGTRVRLELAGTAVVAPSDVGPELRALADLGSISITSTASAVTVVDTVADATARNALVAPTGLIVRQVDNGVRYLKAVGGWEVVTDDAPGGVQLLSGGDLKCSDVSRLPLAGELHLRVHVPSGAAGAVYLVGSTPDTSVSSGAPNFYITVGNDGTLTGSAFGKIVKTRALPGILDRLVTVTFTWDFADSATWVRFYVDGVYVRTYLVSGTMVSPMSTSSDASGVTLGASSFGESSGQALGVRMKSVRLYSSKSSSDSERDARVAGVDKTVGGFGARLGIADPDGHDVPPAVTLSTICSNSGRTITISGTDTLGGGATFIGAPISLDGLVPLETPSSATVQVTLDGVDLGGGAAFDLIAEYRRGDFVTVSTGVSANVSTVIPAFSGGDRLSALYISPTSGAAYAATINKLGVYLLGAKVISIGPEDWTRAGRGVDSTPSGYMFSPGGGNDVVPLKQQDVVRTLPTFITSGTVEALMGSAIELAVNAKGINSLLRLVEEQDDVTWRTTGTFVEDYPLVLLSAPARVVEGGEVGQCFLNSADTDVLLEGVTGRLTVSFDPL